VVLEKKRTSNSTWSVLIVLQKLLSITSRARASPRASYNRTGILKGGDLRDLIGFKLDAELATFLLDR